MRLQEYGDAVTEMSGDIYGDLEALGVASSYRWRHGRSSGTTRLFYYSPDDVVVDATSSYTDGAVQTVANKADAAWHTGATVVVANVAAVSGSEHMEGYRDDMIEQNIEAWGKEYQSVVGERVLNSMSAETYQDPSNYVLDFGLVVADAVPLLGLAKKSGEAVEKTAEALRNLNRAIGEGLQAQHAMRRADDLGAQLAVANSVKGVKPLNSPNPEKWVNQKGGTVWNELDGTWVYKDIDGNVVRYPDGYPDFSGGGYVRQSVDIDTVPNRTTDFTNADKLAPLGPKLPENTWHHHQNTFTMEEIDKIIHKRFTHQGGVSIKKNGD